MSTTTTSSVEAGSLDISLFHYTPNYCEENVYMLCKKLCTNGMADAGGADLFVVFISNEKKQIPLWHQKASRRADGVVLWDYHVICIQRKEGDSTHLVWDLDSTLPFPCPLPAYVSKTMQPSFQLFSDYQSELFKMAVDLILGTKKLFRIVHAPMFFHHFASDRSHMKDSVGNWISQPPEYEPIVAEDGAVHNLNEYFSIQEADMELKNGMDLKSALFTQKLGVVIRENELLDFFSQVL